MKVYEKYYEYRKAKKALLEGNNILCKCAVLDLIDRWSKQENIKISKTNIGFGVWEVKNDSRNMDEQKHNKMSFRACK